MTGAAGSRVAANLRALREARRLNQPQLAARMRELGAELHASAVSKIEKRERRVDVDDLIALAVAIDTTPNRLLLVGEASDAESVELTPEVRVSALDAWKWATGEEPLPAGCAPPDRQWILTNDRERLFTRENQPHNRPEPYFRNVGHDMQDHEDLVRMVAAVIQEAHERGVRLGRLVRLVENLDMRRRFGLDPAYDRAPGDGEDS